MGGYQYRTPSAKFLVLACSYDSPSRVLGDASGRGSGVSGLDCHYRSVLLDPGATGWNITGRGLEPTGTARTKMARSTSSNPSRRHTNHASTRDGLSVGRGQAMASTGSRPLRCARMSGIALWVAQQAHCVDGMVRKAVPCISAMGQASAGRFGFGRSQRALATRLVMNWFDAVRLVEIPRKKALPGSSNGGNPLAEYLQCLLTPFPPPLSSPRTQPHKPQPNPQPSPQKPIPPRGRPHKTTKSHHHPSHTPGGPPGVSPLPTVPPQIALVLPCNPPTHVTPTNGNPPNVCGRGRFPPGPGTGRTKVVTCHQQSCP